VTAASLIWLVVVGVDVYHGLFPEYWPHFALGVALYITLTRTTAAAGRVSFGVVLLALAAISGAAASGSLPFAAPDRAREITVLALTGLALLALRPLSGAIERHAAWRPVALLGTISYSLYLVHQFNLTAATTIGGKLAGAIGLPALATTIAIGVQLGIATVFWRFCERPFLNPPTTRPP
jgi:peptidoglycan/LPS O-acetylase OafA/YrhL